MGASRLASFIFMAGVALVFAMTQGAFGQEAVDAAAAAGGAIANPERPPIPLIWWIAPIGSVIALIMAVKFYNDVKSADEGDPNMILIAGYVRDGAMAYLARQYKVVIFVFIVLAGVLAFMAWGLHVQHKIVPIAFLTGGFFSGLCGYLGMFTATMAAHRTTAGARHSLNRGLVVAFRAGAVMGMVVVGFGLIDIAAWFLALRAYSEMSLHEITVVMLTFGMGASTQALFARVGGGIYTKAADVGADLVGKVEAGIPEDDPRNPASIADNVGDNVGDVAGMGADLYESYCGSILATAALGVAAATAMVPDHADAMKAAMALMSVPMVMAGVGIILSIIGIYMVRTREGATMGQLMGALGRGVNGSSVLIAVATYFICHELLGDYTEYGINPTGIAASVVTGLFSGIVIGKATEYYTSYEFKPTQDIAEQAQTGPATVIIAGVAKGMRSTWMSLATIIVAIMCAFIFAGGRTEFMLGLYGVGIAAVGMLATLGITLATDAYGPIADNAGGNAEMTGQKPEVRERTDALDSLGNTTAATGKGFAIGSAALTALALLAAYVEEVRVGQQREAVSHITQVVENADKDDNAGLEQIYYMGHGKFAEKYKAGTAESSYRAYMCLNLTDEMNTALTKLGDAPMSLTLTTGTREREWIRQGALIGENGTMTMDLVGTNRASLAQYMSFYDVNLMNPKVLCGLFSGVLLAFLFCAMTMEAVGRAAYEMMNECRRQFDTIRSYLKSQGKDDEFVKDTANWPRTQVEHNGQKIPDYANCVAISTAGAQREMVVPSLLAIIIPVVVGLVLGVPGVMGMLAGGLTSGFAVAIFMANAGGAWDNAKKWIETGKFGGKGSDAHKAGIVGDTVGDPFKDTSGPSLNILIKLMSMVSVVFAGLIVKFAPQISDLIGL
jgi:inorganic pyrophosphatase/K(+)-stimulated pyrophosphate-energized sodium pump